MLDKINLGFRKVSVGQILTVPISHGEGRFVASSNDIDTMLENGQILTQYVDFEGNPTMDIQFNPNGSSMAIEGILSQMEESSARWDTPKELERVYTRTYQGSLS